MTEAAPKWRRRKTARPGEIIAAALEVFADKGFAAARLDDIAERAGVSKGALYLYFETKDDLFRAVVRDAVAPNFAAIRSIAEAFDGTFADLAPLLLARAASILSTSRLPAVARLVIGESRSFPDLARVWHDTILFMALGLLTDVIVRAQGRGEVRAGDARNFAFSLIGPVIVGALFREVFGEVSSDPVDLEALAAQHVRTVLGGMLTRAEDQA